MNSYKLSEFFSACIYNYHYRRIPYKYKLGKSLNDGMNTYENISSKSFENETL